jgi:septin family protein
LIEKKNCTCYQAAMPFAIIGSTQDVTTGDGRVVKGREYLWGVAEGKSTPD